MIPDIRLEEMEGWRASFRFDVARRWWSQIMIVFSGGLVGVVDVDLFKGESMGFVEQRWSMSSLKD